MSKTVLVLIDAFRSDYISEKNTPFLYSLLDNALYFKKLEPDFGFCERTEILLGESAWNFGFFTAIGFNPAESPYFTIKHFLNLFCPVFNILPQLGKRIVKRLLWELISKKKGGFPPLSIPLNQLAYFALTEDGVSSAINNHHRSIFNLATAKGLGVNIDCFTSLDSKQIGDDAWRCSRLIDVISLHDKLYLLYIGDCDKYGHILGPESAEFKRELYKVDQRLHHLYKEINNKYDGVNFIFCGDHGMTSVDFTIDILSAVNSALCGFLYGRDYIVFVDSTVFRIWILESSCEKLISELLLDLFSLPEYIEFGHLTTPHKLGVGEGRLYGDLLWLAKPGTVISPDFFNPKGKQIKGMHGYELHESTFGMGICVGPDFEKDTIGYQKLTVMYEVLKTSLGI